MNTITKVKFVFLFILCVATLSVNAHPGRTDSNGGHYDRSTGEYHYHDGKYAGREQSGSTSKKEEKPFTPPREPERKIFIEIIKPDVTFRKGESYEFIAKIPDYYSQNQIVWTSEDESIATFSNNNLTIHEVGGVRINATLEDEIDLVYINTENSKAYDYTSTLMTLAWGLILLFLLLSSIFSTFKSAKFDGCATALGCSIYILVFVSILLAFIQSFL